MEVKQIHSILNSVSGEVLGKSDLVQEDLSNIVDVGTEVFNNNAKDAYVKSLVNHIGKVIFTDRKYSGSVPSVMIDSWEYGSVLEKISADIPEATENDSWNLTDGQEYKQDVFHAPKVSAKFFNKEVTFEVPMSFTEMQVKQSFSNAGQLNGFMSMIENTVEKSMTVKIDNLIMRTINNMTAETIKVDKESGNSPKLVNLLSMYNTKFSQNLTAEQAITNPEFIRYASFVIGLYVDRISKLSTLFNIGKKERFTPSDKLHLVMLSDFNSAGIAYLQSDTFHNEMVKFPNAETVPYWQGSGQDYSFEKISSIDVKTANGDAVKQTGIIAVMFDSDALGVTNLNRRVTTNYNAKAEFYNNYYKFDAGYFNDLNENFVVFYLGNGTEKRK